MGVTFCFNPNYVLGLEAPDKPRGGAGAEDLVRDRVHPAAAPVHVDGVVGVAAERKFSRAVQAGRQKSSFYFSSYTKTSILDEVDWLKIDVIWSTSYDVDWRRPPKIPYTSPILIKSGLGLIDVIFQITSSSKIDIFGVHLIFGARIFRQQPPGDNPMKYLLVEFTCNSRVNPASKMEVIEKSASWDSFFKT